MLDYLRDITKLHKRVQHSLELLYGENSTVKHHQTWLGDIMNAAYREKVMEEKEDMVNQPSHYNYGDIECIDAIKAMLGEEGFRAYCKGSALKYTWRAGLKFDANEDLKKAVWYNRMAGGDDPRIPDVKCKVNVPT